MYTTDVEGVESPWFQSYRVRSDMVRRGPDRREVGAKDLREREVCCLCFRYTRSKMASAYMPYRSSKPLASSTRTL